MPPGAVDDRPLALAHAAVAGEERALAGAGEEAEVLRLALVGDGQPGRARDLAHLRLAQAAEREAHPRQRGRRERGEHVGLILGGVGGGAQQAVVADARVVAGGELLRAEPVREREHRVEPHVPVAAHARVRGQPGGVVGEERRDDAGRERRPQVEREVRQPHPVRHRAREPDGMRGAARGLRVVGLVAPELERHRDGLAARAGDEQRRDGRVHPARHRDERPPGDARRGAVGRYGRAQRDVERVGGQLGRVQLARREPAQLGRDLGRADPRRVEQRGPAHELDDRRPRRHRRAAAGRLEARVRHPLALDPQVDPDEVAAGRSPGAAGERPRGHVSAPPGVLQMLREGLGVHAPSVGPAMSCAARP